MSAIVPLSTLGYAVVIDEADEPLIRGRRWRIERTGRGYVRVVSGYGRGGVVAISTFLLGRQKDGFVIDHINGDTFDNRRGNLRVCTRSQNAANRRAWSSSGKLGVCWNSDSGKWQAGIKSRGRSYHLGLYENLDEAAAAYDRKARELHGPFARLNFGDQA